jgi:hypothetical protein
MQKEMASMASGMIMKNNGMAKTNGEIIAGIGKINIMAISAGGVAIWRARRAGAHARRAAQHALSAARCAQRAPLCAHHAPMLPASASKRFQLRRNAHSARRSAAALAAWLAKQAARLPLQRDACVHRDAAGGNRGVVRTACARESKNPAALSWRQARRVMA